MPLPSLRELYSAHAASAPPVPDRSPGGPSSQPPLPSQALHSAQVPSDMDVDSPPHEPEPCSVEAINSGNHADGQQKHQKEDPDGHAQRVEPPERPLRRLEMAQESTSYSSAASSSPVFQAGTVGSVMTNNYSPASVAAHTAGAQRSIATSNLPKFVVMTGPEKNSIAGGSGRGSRPGTVSPSPFASSRRSPTPRRSPPSPLTTTHNKTIKKKTTPTLHRRGSSGPSGSSSAIAMAASSGVSPGKAAAAKVAAAKAEMISNISYTIDRADGGTVTLGGRNIRETFEISPLALLVNALTRALPSQIRCGPQPARVWAPTSPDITRTVPYTPPPSPTVQPADLSVLALPPFASLANPDMMDLPPIRNPGPFFDRQSRLATLQPNNQAGPRHRLQHTPPTTPPAGVSFPPTQTRQRPSPPADAADARANEERLELEAVIRHAGRLGATRTIMAAPAAVRRPTLAPALATPFLIPEIESRVPAPMIRATFGPHSPHEARRALAPLPQQQHQQQSSLPPQQSQQSQPLSDTDYDNARALVSLRGNVSAFPLLPVTDTNRRSSAAVRVEAAAEVAAAGLPRTFVLISVAAAHATNEQMAEVANTAATVPGRRAAPFHYGVRPASAVEGSGDEALARAALRDIQRMDRTQNEFEEEITPLSLDLDIRVVARQQQQHNMSTVRPMDLRRTHCPTCEQVNRTASASDDDEEEEEEEEVVEVEEAGGRSIITGTETPYREPGARLLRFLRLHSIQPRVVASRLVGVPGHRGGQLGPYEKLVVPRLTVVVAECWSHWTLSCASLDTTAASCFDYNRCGLQPGHSDSRIAPPSSSSSSSKRRFRLVQRGTCRHRHVAPTAAVRRRVVMTRVTRGVRGELVVEERVFYLTAGVGAHPNVRERPRLLAFYACSFFLQIS